jgi:hypothetical protein
MPETVRRHISVVQEFLQRCFGRGPLRLHALGEQDITRLQRTSDPATSSRWQGSRSREPK